MSSIGSYSPLYVVFIMLYKKLSITKQFKIELRHSPKRNLNINILSMVTTFYSLMGYVFSKIRALNQKKDIIGNNC